MQEIIKFILGIIVLALGIPIGNLLAKYTKEELKAGQKWFMIILLISGVGVIYSFIIGEDYLLFTLLFAAVVVSRSLRG
jgi:hypothetical protein